MQIFATAFAILLLLYNTLKAPIKYFIIYSAFRRSTGIMLDLVGFFFVCLFVFYSYVLRHIWIWVDRCSTWMIVSLDFAPPPPFLLKIRYILSMEAETAQRRPTFCHPPPLPPKKNRTMIFNYFIPKKKLACSLNVGTKS